MQHVKSEFTKLVDEVIQANLDVVKEYMAELEELFDFGNPEQVIGKKYEAWNQEDFKKAKAIWGNDPDITNWIARKEIKKTERLEQEVLDMEGINGNI